MTVLASVAVTINGKTYRMACADGEEPHLTGLAERLNGMIDELRGAFGEIGDQRLTVMAAVTALDRLAEAEARIADLEARPVMGGAGTGAPVLADPELAARLLVVAETVERLAASFTSAGRAEE